MTTKKRSKKKGDRYIFFCLLITPLLTVSIWFVAVQWSSEADAGNKKDEVQARP